MKRSLSDLFVLCDMDNTLLTAQEGIPECNASVIRLFTALGGNFSVATGRPPESVRAALGDLKLSAPAITCGGSVIYDFSRETSLRHSSLNQAEAIKAIDEISQAFPEVGIEIYAADGDVYVIHANEITHAHLRDEKISGVLCPRESVPDGWRKVIFAADSRMISQIQKHVKRKYFGHDNYFVATNTIYYEIMPAGTNKASALNDLCQVLDVPPENTIVIGDYYNDLELMRAAGHSVAVANAPREVKVEADEVTFCSCKEGGVGEYLYKLIRECS